MFIEFHNLTKKVGTMSFLPVYIKPRQGGSRKIEINPMKSARMFPNSWKRQFNSSTGSMFITPYQCQTILSAAYTVPEELRGSEYKINLRGAEAFDFSTQEISVCADIDGERLAMAERQEGWGGKHQTEPVFYSSRLSTLSLQSHPGKENLISVEICRYDTKQTADTVVQTMAMLLPKKQFSMKNVPGSADPRVSLPKNVASWYGALIAAREKWLCNENGCPGHYYSAT